MFINGAAQARMANSDGVRRKLTLAGTAQALLGAGYSFLRKGAFAMKSGNKPWSTSSPSEHWDYIIIGSGMGGMTCAAVLAALGRRVLLLEQHYVPGGFTQTFMRKKWVWDVGVHAVGEVDERAETGRILRALTNGELEWASLGNIYDEFHFPDHRIDFPSEGRQFHELLRRTFPEDRVAVDEYVRRLQYVAEQMRFYCLSRLLPATFEPKGLPLFGRGAHRLLTSTTDDVMGSITNNPRLRTALTAQWGYYGSTPDRSAFAIHALVAQHFSKGAFYPVGGSSAIATALCRAIARHGGWTRIKADVEEIVIQNGRAVGVKLRSSEELRARRGIISAAGAIATVTRLLPSSERTSTWAESIASLRQTPCHISLNLGFKGDIRQAGASAANKWFYETSDSSATMWDVRSDKAEAPILYCSFPSLKDPVHDPGPEVLHTGEVVTFLPYESVAPYANTRWGRRPEGYEQLKQEWAERLLNQLLRHMPGLRDKIAWSELSTPISTEFFTRAPQGAIYGIEPTPARFRARYLRPRTPVEGLYLTGSDVVSVGVMGAMVGGLLTATSAEPIRAIPWLARAVTR